MSLPSRGSGQLIIAVLLCACNGLAAPTSYRFRLHKFQQPIGYETVTITNKRGKLQIDSAFEFTDRGTQVPLKAALYCSRDYTPELFTVSGSTSRASTIDTSVTIKGAHATLREGKSSHEVSVPEQFFTIAGYAPAALQESLIHYWLNHGMPEHLPTLPSGSVAITGHGVDMLNIGGKTAAFHRYSVRGLVWGLETLWMDSQGRLAAVITRDAEFDHFEAIREDYEAALPDFIATAAQDGIANLAEIDNRLPGRKTGALAFTGATLIDVTGDKSIAAATVITSGGKIVAAGPSASVTIPSGATRIDVTGKYIIPGLWDMHAHYEQVEWGPIYLAAGVTTTRDVGNEFDFITAIRDANNSGAGLGPRMVLAGLVDGDGPIALGMQRVNSQADAAAWVKKYHDAGFQQIKIYSSVKPEIVKAVCREAHAAGMTVTGHIPQNMSPIEGVEDGMDQVNHITYFFLPLLPENFDARKATQEQSFQVLRGIDFNSPAALRLIALLKEHHTVIDDTAAIFEQNAQPADNPTAFEPGIANLPIELQPQFNNGGVSRQSLPLAQLKWSKTLELIGALHRAGITFVAGTDQGVPGYSVYREIELYVQAGFTPKEALQAATIVPARVMKLDSESGSVETGKRADFDILDANPLEDIHNIRTVRWVVANGTLYDPNPLWQSVGFKPPH